MKETYIAALKDALSIHTKNYADIKDILKDYEEMYDDALASGKTPEAIEAMLGAPEDIVEALQETLSTNRVRRHKGNKIVAISPFLASIGFFISGFYMDGWYYGWMFFLMIPMLAILINAPRRDKLVAISPFISIIAMMSIGFSTGRWELAWLPFLSIPVLGHFTHGNKLSSWLFLFFVLLGIGIYLYYGETESYALSWIGFVPAIIYSIIRGDITISWGELRKQEPHKAAIFLSVILISLGLFIGLGVLIQAWAWSWLFLLAIPMISIVLFAKANIIALMPFISVILFYTTGYFFGLFEISWLAFLLVPITAIIASKD